MTPSLPQSLSQTRQEWVSMMDRIARLPIQLQAEGTLRTNMPVETAPQAGTEGRVQFSALEAFCRTFSGLAPWLVCTHLEGSEDSLRRQYLDWIHAGLENGCTPGHPDEFDFSGDLRQLIVEAAFLSLGLLRSGQDLLDCLPALLKEKLRIKLEAARHGLPPWNNWLLFCAVNEVAVGKLGGTPDDVRIDYAIRQHEQWYKGDGIFADGPYVHCDYYNSFVIHPLLLEILDQTADRSDAWRQYRERFLPRFQRYAEVLERTIAPDGTFPVQGRSLCYRTGVFHALAAAAQRELLPGGLAPAQVRCGLTATLQRVFSAPGTFTKNGWLSLGLAGHQPQLAENYISTGSTYLCATIFLPLGLASSTPFWSQPDRAWTGKAAWEGADIPADHSLSDKDFSHLIFP